MLENRHTVRAERIRSRIFDLVMGEEPGVGAARDVLESASGRTWDHIERQIFAMLPKIKGESRVTLVELLPRQGRRGNGYVAARLSVCGTPMPGRPLSYRRYRGVMALLIAVWAAVEENVGYRQLTAWWRMRGSLQAIRGAEHTWGDMERKGFSR